VDGAEALDGVVADLQNLQPLAIHRPDLLTAGREVKAVGEIAPALLVRR
jgi:hypothetical protein